MTQVILPRDNCPCGGSIRPVDGFLVCTSCGEVKGRDYRAGTFCFTTNNGIEAEPAQHVEIAKKPNVVDCGGSLVGKRHEKWDGNGHRLNQRANLRARRMRHWNRRVRIDLNPRLFGALSMLNRLAVSLELPRPVRYRAAVIVKACLRKNISDAPAVVIGAMMFALRELGIPMKRDEVLAKYPGTRMSSARVNRTLFKIQKVLGKPYRPQSPMLFIERFINALRIDSQVRDRLRETELTPAEYFTALRRKGRELLSNAPRVDGRRRDILAASALYAAERSIRRAYPPVLTQRILARICETSEFSIRDHWNFVWKPLLGGDNR